MDGSVFEARLSVCFWPEHKLDSSTQGQFKNGDKCGKGKFTWNTGGNYEALRKPAGSCQLPWKLPCGSYSVATPVPLPRAPVARETLMPMICMEKASTSGAMGAPTPGSGEGRFAVR